ncbi:MAG: hypothetical protein HZC28_17005 [Spirochaetes bacterium]|nr:hypothetical protein [Spirochaetota bacterium]
MNTNTATAERTSLFDFGRMPAIASRLSNWWSCGDQERPCIIATVESNTEDASDDLTRHWMDVDGIITRTIGHIDNTRYFGEAVPYHYLDLGASAMACTLGGTVEFVDTTTIWSHPSMDSLEVVAALVPDRTNPYYRLLIETAKRSAACAKGHHFIAPYALGGLLDTVAGLYGTEPMLIDMIERPALLKQALENMKRIWIASFNEIETIIAKSGNRGGIGWAGIWAPGTTFPVQEDCSYMFSADMFREFCVPHLSDIFDAMDYPFYHLDGVGAIVHLDALLKMKNLKAIQWQPGAGKERLSQWYELIRKIIAAGKACQVYARPDEIDDLVKNVGAKGLLVITRGRDIDEAERITE